MRAFRLLGEAEGRIHGVPAEEVALHEVGAMDALVDVVGAIEGFEQLGIERIHHRPVAVGSGWVRAAHGVIPVPAPATAVLLEGIEIVTDGPVVGEATTPTGAVLLRVLSSGPPPARWRIAGAGAWGAGGRDPEGYPNALRLILAEPAREAGEVVLLSTDLDDLSPEYLEPLREALFAGRRARRPDVGDPDEEGPDRLPGGGGGAPGGGRSGDRGPRPAQHDGRCPASHRGALHPGAAGAAGRRGRRDQCAGEGLGRTRRSPSETGVR